MPGVPGVLRPLGCARQIYPYGAVLGLVRLYEQELGELEDGEEGDYYLAPRGLYREERGERRALCAAEHVEDVVYLIRYLEALGGGLHGPVLRGPLKDALKRVHELEDRYVQEAQVVSALELDLAAPRADVPAEHVSLVQLLRGVLVPLVLKE